MGDWPRVAAGTNWIDATKAPYYARGDGTTDDSAAIQAAINAVNSSWGGTVYLPQGTYYCATGLTATIPGTMLVGDGIPAVSSEYGAGTTQILVGNSQWGITLGSASSTTFKGFATSGIMFLEKNAGQATGGVRLLRGSDSFFDHMACGQFTAGTGMLIDGTGDVNQYTQLNDCRFGKCTTGLSLVTVNGLRLMGCNFDGNTNGTAGFPITSGTKGLVADATCDTLRAVGTVFQGYDELVNLQGFYHRMVGCRFEIYRTVAVRVGATALGISVVSSTANNFIEKGLNGGTNIGTVAIVTSGAVDTELDIYATDFLTYLTDAGTRTRVSGALGKEVSATTVSGHTVIGKVPYILNGTIVGYIPVYDALT